MFHVRFRSHLGHLCYRLESQDPRNVLITTILANVSVWDYDNHRALCVCVCVSVKIKECGIFLNASLLSYTETFSSYNIGSFSVCMYAKYSFLADFTILFCISQVVKELINVASTISINFAQTWLVYNSILCSMPLSISHLTHQLAKLLLPCDATATTFTSFKTISWDFHVLHVVHLYHF